MSRGQGTGLQQRLVVQPELRLHHHRVLTANQIESSTLWPNQGVAWAMDGPIREWHGKWVTQSGGGTGNGWPNQGVAWWMDGPIRAWHCGARDGARARTLSRSVASAKANARDPIWPCSRTRTRTHTHTHTHTYTHAHAQTRTTNTPIQRHLDTTSSRKPLLLRFQKARHYREKIYGVYGKNMSCRRAVAQTIPACHHTSRTDEYSCLCLACATPRLLVSRQSQLYLLRTREPKFKKQKKKRHPLSNANLFLLRRFLCFYFQKKGGP